MIGLQLVPPIDATPGSIAATLKVTSSEGGVYAVPVTGTILGTTNPGPDASVDGARGAVDTAQDASILLFPALPGHTFQISASNTPPDASAENGVPYNSPSGNANYDLTFSADGIKVHLVRMDAVQEATLDGVLVSQTDSTLRYTVNTGLGGDVLVWQEGGTLVARLDLSGSGVPDVLCIQSPMPKV